MQLLAAFDLGRSVHDDSPKKKITEPAVHGLHASYLRLPNRQSGLGIVLNTIGKLLKCAELVVRPPPDKTRLRLGENELIPAQHKQRVSHAA